MKDNKIKTLIVIIIFAILFICLYFCISYIFKKNDTDNEEKMNYLKNYEVNQYIPTYISDEAMAKIYLNDYIYNMYYDTKKAYELLDIDYRTQKFGSYENYITYVNSLTYSTYKLEKYYKEVSGEYIIFGVYDSNGLFYAFKTNGVLQYSVYLDDYTVEI